MCMKQSWETLIMKRSQESRLVWRHIFKLKFYLLAFNKRFISFSSNKSLITHGNINFRFSTVAIAITQVFQCEFYHTRRTEAGSDARISLPHPVSPSSTNRLRPPTKRTSIPRSSSVVLSAPSRSDVRSPCASYVRAFGFYLWILCGMCCK